FSRSGATNVLLVTLLVPVSATLLGVFVLRERLLVRHWIAMACIASGLLLIEGRLAGVAARIVGREREP
ncbi:MAG: EamA family transporter, partial [Spirochaetales bacterium]|nr:EamA family transporter [Spirochaetales bacterium]